MLSSPPCKKTVGKLRTARYIFASKEVDFFIDIGAERLVAAWREEEKIAVEIKTFNRASIIGEFHTALGQFMNYRLALASRDPERQLFLAVPKDVYHDFFQAAFGQTAIRAYQLKLLVYDIQTEEIVTWQK